MRSALFPIVVKVTRSWSRSFAESNLQKRNSHIPSLKFLSLKVQVHLLEKVFDKRLKFDENSAFLGSGHVHKVK